MSGGNNTTLLTQETFLERCMSHKNMCHLDFSNTVYRNSRTLVEINCLKHGEYVTNPTSAMNGHGCPVCDCITFGKSSPLTISEYIIVANYMHNDKYDYSLLTEENFKDEKIPVICKEHGKFLIRKSAHIAPKQLYSCQICGRKYSKGEEFISEYLTKNNIKFEREKTFFWSKGINDKMFLPFDFYLSELEVIIEFDGSHHFKPTRYGSQSNERALLQYKRTVLYDGMKTMNAFLLNIKVIRIAYYMYDKIEEILDYELQDYQNKKFAIYRSTL